MATPSMGVSSPSPTPAAASSVSSGSGLITATVVPDHARMAFLPRVFGSRHYPAGESAVFDWMKALCPAYSGGFWDFVDLSNGGFYLRLRTDKAHFDVFVDGSGFEGRLSPDAASIVATMFAINQLLWGGADHLDGAFYKLREYAMEHAEARQILGAID